MDIDSATRTILLLLRVSDALQCRRMFEVYGSVYHTSFDRMHYSIVLTSSHRTHSRVEHKQENSDNVISNFLHESLLC